MQDVFISYARKSSAKEAQMLRGALESRDISTFLDSSDLELGDRFPEAIARAILASRIVVVFVGDLYFKSWYCLRELRTALGPFDLAMRRVPRDEAELTQCLQSIVIGLPDRSTSLDQLPHRLSVANWPLARETDRLVRLIQERLLATTQSIAGRLPDLRAFELMTSFEEDAAIPPPSSLDGIPKYKRGFFDLSLREYFVGRADDLERLHSLLSPGSGLSGGEAARTVQLTAAGGFGKTRVALEYLWRYGPRYYNGGLFWIDAESDKDLEDQFYGIWKVLRETQNTPAARRVPELRVLRKQKIDLRKLLEEAFESLGSAQPALCVVDNIPERERPESVRHYFPALGKLSVVITGRQSVPEPGITVLELDRLPEAASLLMLTRELKNGHSISEPEWREIAEWVGHLPLALELLRWAILDSGFQPKDVLAHARKRARTTVELDSAAEQVRTQVPAAFVRGVTQTLKITYDGLDPASKLAAQILAQYAPVPIPEELVTALGATLIPPVVRAKLTSRHLLTGGGENTYGSMHRIIRDYILGIEPAKKTKPWNHACAALLTILTEERCQAVGRDIVVQLCQPHAVEIYSNGTRHGEPFKGGQQAAAAIELGRRAGLLLRNQGRYQESVELLRSVMASGFVLLNDPENELASQLEVCRGLEELGNWQEAANELNILLRFCRQLLPADHWISLRATLCLGRVLTRSGDAAAGQKAFENVLHLIGELAPLEEGLMGPVKGGFQEQAAHALNDLALSLKQQGELEEAQKIYEDILVYFRSSSGEESLDTMRTKSNLAKVLFELGDVESLQKARQMQEEIVPKLDRALGPSHRFTLIAKDNLANTLKALGEVRAAMQLQATVVSMFENSLGKSHPDTLTAKKNLAATYVGTGDIDQAVDLIAEVLKAEGGTVTDDKKSELREKLLTHGLQALE
jgi:tetratricopeptide (TPR) repeat protein